MLLLRNGKVQLVTKPEHHELVSQFLKEEMTEELTPASLETLAIIAYMGPVPRAKIDYLRGVNSLFTLRSLRLRGLIERISDPENSNGFLYQASFDLLKHLGVPKEAQLPEYEKFHALLERFRVQGGESAKEPTNDTPQS
jgi:segregation and condensation protein B